MAKYQELYDIIEEEESIIDPENTTEARTKAALGRVIGKMQDRNYDFTNAEKSAIRNALEDVGELYLFAGTSGGFDVESKAQEREHQSRGEKARQQAYRLGIRLK